MSNRKVVAELNKLWDAVATKGRLTAEGKVHDLKHWVSESPTITAFQSNLNDKVSKFQKDFSNRQLSAEDVAEKTKEKVGRLMRTYEELIGISEVKSAHARVLSSEAKFIECQGSRRLASKELSAIHNKLMEIRAELDRTQRGDDAYLDLIRQEITATKQERIVRKQFEDLERTEREVFAELSSALRFSHEKERAQNEKTKYWSVVGSIVGATLGVIGTTVNNRMKQNHIKHVLEETSAQVTAIQGTVETLSKRVNEGSLTADEMNRIVESAKFQGQDTVVQQEKLTKALQESLKMLQELIVRNPSYRQEELPTIDNSQVPMSYENVKSQIYEKSWPLTVLACCLASVLLYKFT